MQIQVWQIPALWAGDLDRTTQQNNETQQSNIVCWRSPLLLQTGGMFNQCLGKTLTIDTSCNPTIPFFFKPLKGCLFIVTFHVTINYVAEKG